MRKTKQCRHGVFTYYTQDYYIGGALEVTGENSPAELERLKLLVRPDAHVVMAGANIGTLAVPMAKYLAHGRLLAFEPEPATHHLLCENFDRNDRNGMDWYCVSPFALGDREGKVRINRIDYDAEIYNSGASTIITGTAVVPTVEVDMITLDSLNLDRLDLLHADVEGSELAVIRGAARTIRKFRPFLYVENNHKPQSAALIAAIDSFGYRCHWHLPPLFNPDPAGGLLVSANMLCVPVERQVDPAILDDTFPVLADSETCDDAYRRLAERSAAARRKGAMR